MISRDIEVVDVHPEHWIHLLRGPDRPGVRESNPKGQGWLVVIHEQGRAVHAVLRGRPIPELLGRPVDDLAGWRKRFSAKRVVCLERGFMRRTLTRADSSLSYHMDYVQQLLILIDAFRKERGSGIAMDPPSPPGPLPPYGLLQKTLDLLWPNDTSLVLYVIDDDRDQIWTSLMLRKRGGDVDLMTTDLYLGPQGLDPATWRDDRLRLLGRIQQAVARPHLACFASLQAWQRWLDAPLGSDELVRLQAGRDLFLEPWPRRVCWPMAGIRFLARSIRRVRRPHPASDL